MGSSSSGWQVQQSEPLADSERSRDWKGAIVSTVASAISESSVGSTDTAAVAITA